MNTRFLNLTVVGFAVALVAALGCRKESIPAEKTVASAAKLAEAAGNPAVVAKLVAADAVDGAVDGVVTRCGGCKLGMDGTDELTLTVGDHKMRFCSNHCQSSFAGDPTKRILALSIPDGQ